MTDIRKFSPPKPVTDGAPGTLNTQVRTVAPELKPISEIPGTTPPVVETKDAAPEGATPESKSYSSLVDEYREYLHDNGVQDQDIFALLDSILTSGTAVWAFDLLDRILVHFRMRPTWVNDQVMSLVEAQSPKTYARFTELVGMYNLAGSLLRYGDRLFAMENMTDFDEALSFVRNLPHAIVTVLLRKLSLFDMAAVVATSDWAVENFTKPPSDE